MKLISIGIAILKWSGNAEVNSLGMATDVSSYGYFQRGAVKEIMSIVACAVPKRTQPGQRQSVQQDGYFCHAHNWDGLVGVVFVGKEYPPRSVFCVVRKVIDDFIAIHGTEWRAAPANSYDTAAMLQPALEKYQHADKLAKIQSDLDETKVLHHTIESLLERGEKLDTLVEKSEGLSLASRLFLEQARPTNSCCKLR